jgi:UDP-2,4-diacetamido-2,4,6-trideoxy-beta-L-altropyranose hydrolase
MAALLTQADLVVGAAGSSAYERCCLGKPTILLQTAENQSGNIAALVRAGAARTLGKFGGVSTGAAREVIIETLKDLGSLDRMAVKAASLVDANGVLRVVDAIETSLCSA